MPAAGYMGKNSDHRRGLEPVDERFAGEPGSSIGDGLIRAN
jgi:hypothetical protein